MRARHASAYVCSLKRSNQLFIGNWEMMMVDRLPSLPSITSKRSRHLSRSSSMSPKSSMASRSSFDSCVTISRYSFLRRACSSTSGRNIWRNASSPAMNRQSGLAVSPLVDFSAHHRKKIPAFFRVKLYKSEIIESSPD